MLECMPKKREPSPLEVALRCLWESSKLSFPPAFEPPVQFDTTLIEPFGIGRRRGLADFPAYVKSMQVITAAVVVADSTQSLDRRIELCGQRPHQEYHPPRLNIALERDAQGNMVDCAVYAQEAAAALAPADEHRLAKIPLALLAADLSHPGVADLCTEWRLPQVARLVHAAGAVLLQGAVY